MWPQRNCVAYRLAFRSREEIAIILIGMNQLLVSGTAHLNCVLTARHL
jgi:hypothetical protein